MTSRTSHDLLPMIAHMILRRKEQHDHNTKTLPDHPFPEAYSEEEVQWALALAQEILDISQQKPTKPLRSNLGLMPQ